jgi:hypothetical protein
MEVACCACTLNLEHPGRGCSAAVDSDRTFILPGHKAGNGLRERLRVRLSESGEGLRPVSTLEA